MSTLCTEALNQCVNGAHVAQALVAQCSSLLAEPHVESHIAHATAVLSELGLGISSAALADPFAWRNTITQVGRNSADVIKRTNFLVEAKSRGPVSFAINWALEMKFKDYFVGRFFIIYMLPIISWICAFWVLIGISFPDRLKRYSLTDQYFFWVAATTFVVSFAAAFVIRKQFETAKGVDTSLDKVI